MFVCYWVCIVTGRTYYDLWIGADQSGMCHLKLTESLWMVPGTVLD